jgi:hypothetical protein
MFTQGGNVLQAGTTRRDLTPAHPVERKRAPRGRTRGSYVPVPQALPEGVTRGGRCSCVSLCSRQGWGSRPQLTGHPYGTRFPKHTLESCLCAESSASWYRMRSLACHSYVAPMSGGAVGPSSEQPKGAQIPPASALPLSTHRCQAWRNLGQAPLQARAAYRPCVCVDPA